MQINSPLCITSRLLPGVKIGGAEISIEYAHLTLDGRQVYRWFVDLDNCEGATAQNLESGAGGGTLQKGLESLLGYLGVFAKEWRYKLADGLDDCVRPNCDLFISELAEWAIKNRDQIVKLELNLQEYPNQLIIE